MTPEQKKAAIIAALSGSAEAYKRAAAMFRFSRQLTSSYKKREEKWREIDLKRFSLRAATPEDSRQLALWREALQFEAGNPLGLPAEILRSRQETAFRRCLGCCYFAPEMWRDFAVFESFYDIGASGAIWRKAIAAMPQSSLLRLAYADMLENRGDVAAARAAYEEMAETAGNPAEWVRFSGFFVARREFHRRGRRFVARDWRCFVRRSLWRRVKKRGKFKNSAAGGGGEQGPAGGARGVFGGVGTFWRERRFRAGIRAISAGRE